MKSAEEQLSTYKSVHLNPKNIKTHFVGVPLIIWSLFLLLNLIPVTFFALDTPAISINVASVFAIGVLLYYIKLHARLALGLALFIIPVLYTSSLVAQVQGALWIALAVFVIGWVFQLIGHQYEKAKPAFIDDLNQLLIGPFFLMAEVYFLLGLEKELDKQITPMAVDKRRALEDERRAARL
ncbi:Mpo1 family 2-hydroxy fatty acid dioxygenase [Shewanella woodyi]|uniref:Mpo1 family 2-hydroxy fatty acid dioxygenase n=1 Tax=Shewanella woodyi TaxID=60961 RepID=UPI0007F8B25F|nr:Mpo1-like protein [Shewanella woodyi]